jgi:hypothetical protein
MKALGVATVIFGLLITPLYAQAQKTVTFNGNVFDAPGAPGPQVQPTPAKPKTSHHAKKRVQS